MSSILITEDFIKKILHNFELNKEQCKILNIGFPLVENWEVLILGREIKYEDAELLVLLRGDLSIKNQVQVTKNYSFLKSINLLDTNTENEASSSKESENETLIIYTDGACKNNPGEAGSGIAIYQNNTVKVLYGSYTNDGTNNISELNALLYGLEIARKFDGEVIIYSDSKYAIECVSIWAYKWKENSWTKKGGGIKNLQLIQEAHYLFDDIKDRVVLQHVKGHAGIEGNELSDRMAVHAINKKQVEYTEYHFNSISAVLNLDSY
jgi:ribonuclease HI